MPDILAAGTYICTVSNAELGTSQSGRSYIRIVLRLVESPHTGRLFWYLAAPLAGEQPLVHYAQLLRLRGGLKRLGVSHQQITAWQNKKSLASEMVREAVLRVTKGCAFQVDVAVRELDDKIYNYVTDVRSTQCLVNSGSSG